MESTKTSITASAAQQDRETEEQVFQICARAGVCCIGIQSGFGAATDLVLFQPTATTVAILLAECADPDRAIAAIKTKLAESGFRGVKGDAATACSSHGGGHRTGNGRRTRVHTVWLWRGRVIEVTTAAVFGLWVLIRGRRWSR